MPKKTLIGILFILILSTTIAVINPISPAIATEPTKLKIYVGPTSVPADNGIYECIFVQLQDSNSKPSRATEDATISLSSSLTSVGDVEPTITISKGNTYAVAKFDTTFTPGTTTIAATASGYGTVQTSLTTVAPVPSKLALYGFPAVLPSDSTPYYALVVQLQDSGGNPAKAPLGGITVTLTSSNSTIASVPSSATISGGQTYTRASVISSATGSAVITAQTSGYTSTQATINTQQPATTQPKSLRIYVAPPKNLADNAAHSQIVVQLINAAGTITRSETPITIQLTSSSENVGTVQPTLEIPVGQVYATATFSTTYKAGTTTITAAATDLITDTETITTIGPIPSKLAVYFNPSTLPADKQGYDVIQVQLQDTSGKPALDPNGDVTVSLFSSDPTVGTVPATLTIPYGRNYAIATFTSTYVASSTTITAQASGYTTGQSQIRTYLIDQSSLTVTVTSEPTTVVSGKQTNITAYVVDPGGTPTSDATVKFTSSGGGTFATVKALGNGYYSTMFTTPNFNTSITVTITANVSKTDYKTSIATTQITVVPTVKYGTMQICVRDYNELPISNANVSSLLQPSGMGNLTAKTNSSGFVTFENVAEGNYTFSVNKPGYEPMNTTVNFKTESKATTFYLIGGADSQPNFVNQSADLTYVWIVIAVAVAVVVVVVAFVMLLRRRHSQGP
jgi:hypothetical protein